MGNAWCWRNQQLYFDLSPGDDPGPPDLVDLRPGLDPGLLGEDGHVHAQLGEEAEHHAAHGERGEHLAREDLRVVGRLGAVAACADSVAPSGLV